MCLRALLDENPRVQMRAIVALARCGDVTAAATILPLAKAQKMIVDDSEKWVGKRDSEGWSVPHRAIPHTALKAVVKLNAVDLLLRKLDDTELRETALRGLQEIHSERVVAGLAAKIDATGDKQLVKLITLALFRLYHHEAPWNGRTWWKNRPNFSGPYYKSAAWEHTPLVKAAIEAAFGKAAPADYAYLFKLMRMNQVPESDLELNITFDEVLSLLDKRKLTDEEHTRVMNAVADKTRPEEQRLKIYNYFKAASLPESYFKRAYILRVWGEGKAKGKLQRQAYADFVSGKEFIGKVQELEPFFKNS